MARFRRRFASAVKKNYKWCGDIFLSDSRTTNGTTENVICDITELAEFTGPKIVRIRGHIDLFLGISTTAPTATGQADVALTLTLQDATSTTPPAIEPGAGGWDRSHLWRAYRHLRTEFMPVYNGTTIDYPEYSGPLSSARIEVDMKASRNIPNEHELYLLLGVANISADRTLSMRGKVAVLIEE